jgi:hypothetical protein
VTGAAGSNGAAGPTGPTGATGATGSTGPNALTSDSTNTTRYVPFTSAASGTVTFYGNTGFKYNPSAKYLTINNIVVGAGTSGTALTGNVALGDSLTLNSITTGTYNVGLGSWALFSTNSGSYNIAIGHSSMLMNMSGGYNISIGASSLYGNSGSNNVAIGDSAARFQADGSTSLTSAANSVYIGYGTRGFSNSDSNSIVIGYNAIGKGANTTVVGNSSTTAAYIYGYLTNQGVNGIKEKVTVSATSATGTVNFDTVTQSVLYYSSDASGNFTVNIRGDGSTTLNSLMSTGDSITLAFLVTNGSTAYYQTGFQIDGNAVTPKWQRGTAPSAGSASAIDSYVFTIIKTGDAAFTVLESQTKFA